MRRAPLKHECTRSRCFNSLQFKTERNNGPRVSAKKKQGDVNAGMRTIAEQLPISWTECMATIDAAFPDPAETCKYLQNDTKRVPRSAVTKSCTLVRCRAALASLCTKGPRAVESSFGMRSVRTELLQCPSP